MALKSHYLKRIAPRSVPFSSFYHLSVGMIKNNEKTNGPKQFSIAQQPLNVIRNLVLE